MVELLVAMTLMALIMVPLFGMLKASVRIAATSSQRESDSTIRQAALEGISRRLEGSTDVLDVQDQSLVVLLADGQKGRLSFDGELLIMETDKGAEVLVQGLAKLRFSLLSKPTTATDGWLIGVDVLTISASPTYNEAISNTQIWIRPAI